MNRLILICALLGPAFALGAQFDADFDSWTEGDFSELFSDGGIVFHSLQRDLPGGPNNFAIENASSGQLAGSSLPNVMGIGGYLVGPDVAFGRFKSCEFNLDAPAFTMRSAALDIWTFNLHQAGNTLFLEGYFEGQLVDSDSFTPGSFAIAHKRMSLPDDDYDRFVLRSTGTVDNGVVFLNFDNVRIIGEVVPEPATVAAILMGLAALRARSRRRST